MSLEINVNDVANEASVLRIKRGLHEGTHKLSCGPNTFVGIAEVKLSPYWSLYAI